VLLGSKSAREGPDTITNPSMAVAVDTHGVTIVGRPPAPPARHPSERRRGAGRRVDAWDVLGLMATTAAMLGVQLASTAALGYALGRSHYFRDTAIVATLASLALLAWLVIRDRPRPRDVVRRLSAVWTDPPGDWVAAALGALLAVPVLDLYVPMLLGDADSARVISAVRFVEHHGPRFLAETQDNFLPHVVLGPIIAIGGLAGAKLFSIVSVQVLAGVSGYVTRRITGSMLAAAAGTFALVAIPAVVSRGNYVPMYPVMLALGYLGAWLAYEVITEPDRRWLRAGAAGVCLALAPEAQPVGVLFLVTPIVLVVFAPTIRLWLGACGRIYLALFVAALPRIALNLSIGGLDRFASYRTDYWITKGYVREIQSNFWSYSRRDESLREYLGGLPWSFVHSLGTQGWVVVALAGLAWLLAGRVRGRLFVVAVVGAMALAVTAKKVPHFPRYYSPLWPGIAILCGVGVAALARRRTRVPKVLACLATLGLVFLAGSTLHSVARSQDSLRARVAATPSGELAAVVDDGKGVIGSRSHNLLNVTADIPTWGGQFLSEEEYVTYLTWPSDEAVVAVMERHDIGWVLIHADRRFETDYHDTWLLPHHGLAAGQVDAVEASPRFCRYREISGFVLYRLGSCAQDG
jgi:hypothetical protein